MTTTATDMSARLAALQIGVCMSVSSSAAPVPSARPRHRPDAAVRTAVPRWVPGYTRWMKLPFEPPLEPMLAKARRSPGGRRLAVRAEVGRLPAIVFRDGDEVCIQSRDLKPIDRYFPELAARCARPCPERCVVDGEIVDRRARRARLRGPAAAHPPAESRVKMLAAQSPASFVAWDLLALGDEDLARRPCRAAAPPRGGARPVAPAAVHLLTPATTDRALAEDWFRRFEGAGLDGVIAKRLERAYQPGKRAMIKIKHQRTADCVVAGFRWHKNGPGTHVGLAAARALRRRRHAPPRRRHVVVHVGSGASILARAGAAPRERARGPSVARVGRVGRARRRRAGQRLPGATSRWNRGKDLSWEPLRAERVVEVAYDHLQGDRFRHATTFKRWRPDKRPRTAATTSSR